MTLDFDERTVRRQRCPDCGTRFEHVTGFVEDGSAHAVYYAACHGKPEHLAQVDVILGPWGDGTNAGDRVHFACFLRSDGAMAVDAPVAIRADAPPQGARLDRDDALVHPQLAEFWRVVDFLAERDGSVRSAVYESRKPLWKRLVGRRSKAVNA